MSTNTITKQKIKELESKIDFKEICDRLIDSLYITDGEGTTLYVNQKYLELGDLKAEEIIGKSVYEINEEKELYTNGVLPTVLKTKEMAENIGTLVRTNTKLHVTGIPIFDENGEIKYAIAHQKDIKRLEDLQENLAELRLANNSDSAELEYLRQKQFADVSIVAESDNMREAFAIVNAIAGADVTVLITGESGTGKEVLCDTIYRNSTRNGKPFIKINCSAIPGNLLESELFGYEPGSFTGANKNGKAGLIEIANGGILLLDEIGDMPLDLQAKLLRVLQEKKITRIGGSKEISVDFRVLASTNKDLETEIKNGTFRDDLYYRLNVVPIHLKPLKERPEDLDPLIEKFLENYNNKYNKNVIITIGALDLMHEYDWPGNIRELKNIIERMVVINKNEVIDVEFANNILNIRENIKINRNEGSDSTLKGAVAALEIRMITKAISTYGSKRKAAAALGIDHSTLVKKCQKYNL